MQRYSTDHGRIGRRGLLRGAAGVLVASAAPRAARAEPAATPRILVLGDSMIAGAFGLFLARDLAEQHGLDVERRGKSSSGLSRPDFFDWRKEAQALVDAHRPDATVVMFGGNDVQGLYMGRDQWIRWDDEGWSEEYARRVVQLCDIVAPDGQDIFWVGMPVMRPAKFHERIKRVNTIYRAEMAIRPGAHFVDIWSLLADEHGAYADRIVLEPPAEGHKPKRVRVRAGDGIHLSPAGAQYLADHVRAVIVDTLDGQTAAVGDGTGIGAVGGAGPQAQP